MIQPRSARAPAAVATPVARKRAKAVTDEAAEGRYSIRVTSRLTSIELDTLRMWERRYGFPLLTRASGGSRLDSQGDVEALKLVRRGLEQGFRPSEIVGKSSEELSRLLVIASTAPAPMPNDPAKKPTLAALLATLARDDVATLRAELHRAAVVLGPKRFVVDVAHPLRVRVGVLWAEGKLEVRHEHMVSECLSADLSVMRAACRGRAGAPRVLLTTLPNERYGLGLELVAVYLAVHHLTPLLIGVDTPPEQIAKAAHGYAVDAVGLLVTHASELETTARQVRWLLGELPRRVSVWIGGGAEPDLEMGVDGPRIVATWSDLDAAIASLERVRG